MSNTNHQPSANPQPTLKNVISAARDVVHASERYERLANDGALEQLNNTIRNKAHADTKELLFELLAIAKVTSCQLDPYNPNLHTLFIDDIKGKDLEYEVEEFIDTLRFLDLAPNVTGRVGGLSISVPISSVSKIQQAFGGLSKEQLQSRLEDMKPAFQEVVFGPYIKQLQSALEPFGVAHASQTPKPEVVEIRPMPNMTVLNAVTPAMSSASLGD